MRPRRLLAVGDHLIVIACGVGGGNSGMLGIGDSNEPKRRVGCGRLQLALEGQQAASDDIGLGGVELVSEAFEALPLVGDEVDLEWSGFADTPPRHEIPS